MKQRIPPLGKLPHEAEADLFILEIGRAAVPLQRPLVALPVLEKQPALEIGLADPIPGPVDLGRHGKAEATRDATQNERCPCLHRRLCRSNPNGGCTSRTGKVPARTAACRSIADLIPAPIRLGTAHRKSPTSHDPAPRGCNRARKTAPHARYSGMSKRHVGFHRGEVHFQRTVGRRNRPTKIMVRASEEKSNKFLVRIL